MTTTLSPTDASTPEAWLRPRAEAAARSSGCELVELAVHARGTRARIELTVDRPEGVGVEDCARVSRALSAALEGTATLGSDWVLEVSSPGLTRVLRTPADCARFAGRLARIETRRPIGGRTTFRGRLAPPDTAGDEVRIDDPEAGEPVAIAWPDVASARLDFDPPGAGGRPHRGGSR